MLKLVMKITYRFGKAKGDVHYMSGRLNIMFAIISLHVKATSGANQLYAKPNILSAATYRHVKPTCDADHMHAKPNTIVHNHLPMCSIMATMSANVD